jgi:muramoyltetrapeptide carboxypeptidase
MSGLPAPSYASAPSKVVKPAALRKGDVVGVFAPSGVVSDETIEKSVRNIEALGFKPKLAPNIRAARGNYAGLAVERAADVHAMFANAEVKALWAARGGSGCAAILPLLDYARIRRTPKIVVGYSDITALLLALYRHCGLVCFHGPVAASTPSDFSVKHLTAMLMEPRAQYAFDASSIANGRTLFTGVAEGVLIGGNLSIVSALVGTPYAAQLDGALLFLEEVREAPYRIDRMLTQLRQSDALRRVAGVMMGSCRECVPTDKEPSLSLDETLDEHFQALRVPAVSGLSFGHVPQQWTLPIGIRARLDAELQTLTLLESATVA